MTNVLLIQHVKRIDYQKSTNKLTILLSNPVIPKMQILIFGTTDIF
jgi:glycogen synthase